MTGSILTNSAHLKDAHKKPEPKEDLKRALGRFCKKSVWYKYWSTRRSIVKETVMITCQNARLLKTSVVWLKSILISPSTWNKQNVKMFQYITQVCCDEFYEIIYCFFCLFVVYGVGGMVMEKITTLPWSMREDRIVGTDQTDQSEWVDLKLNLTSL